MNNMFRINNQRNNTQKYSVQPIIFDGTPIMRKHLMGVKHVVGLGVLSCTDDRVMTALAIDTLSDMIVSVLSVYDEDMQMWRRATLSSQVFPDYITMMDTYPNTLILKDSAINNGEYFLNSVSAQLGLLSEDILNELEYWLRSLVTIPRPMISAIQATKVSPNGICCNIFYLK